MDESDRNTRLKRQIALSLAAWDMEQAAAAAQALLGNPEDDQLALALETAVSVCYSRAFTWSGLVQLDRDEYAPDDEEHFDLHYELLRLRDKLYAHTDMNTGRSATFDFAKNRDSMSTTEESPRLTRDELEAVIEMCDLQQSRFRGEIFDIQDELDEKKTE